MVHELRHNLRHLTGSHGATAWHACQASESAHRLSMGVRRLASLIEWGDELSARQALGSAAGNWDSTHVAIAQHEKPDAFTTCDSAQAQLARKAGLKRVRLFT